jgi:hypothetical protein
MTPDKLGPVDQTLLEALLTADEALAAGSNLTLPPSAITEKSAEKSERSRGEKSVSGLLLCLHQEKWVSGLLLCVHQV